jgi:hypothetical protein
MTPYGQFDFRRVSPRDLFRQLPASEGNKRFPLSVDIREIPASEGNKRFPFSEEIREIPASEGN